ncbi:MAG: hypothetical protein M3256_26140 [Actinomycetota bacterium]|nr:hypothetical protein [Actinomycetota bacterium]MDQ6949633.1 hypothetical protein [Actinomycetota bacterium]
MTLDLAHQLASTATQIPDARLGRHVAHGIGAVIKILIVLGIIIGLVIAVVLYMIFHRRR